MNSSSNLPTDLKPVNMSPKKLATWLGTEESKAVGFKTAESLESVGHRSGKKMVALLGKSQAEFTSGDISKTHWR